MQALTNVGWSEIFAEKVDLCWLEDVGVDEVSFWDDRNVQGLC